METKDQIELAHIIGKVQGLISSIESGTFATLRNKIIDENKSAALSLLEKAQELIALKSS